MALDLSEVLEQVRGWFYASPRQRHLQRVRLTTLEDVEVFHEGYTNNGIISHYLSPLSKVNTTYMMEEGTIGRDYWELMNIREFTSSDKYDYFQDLHKRWGTNVSESLFFMTGHGLPGQD